VNYIPMRLRILIGIAVVLTPLVIWRIVSSGGTTPSLSPEAQAIREDQISGNVEGLTEKVKTYSPQNAGRAVTILGHMGPKSQPILKAILRDDKRPEIRQLAADALAVSIQASAPAKKPLAKQTTAALVTAVATDKSPEVRAAAASALGHVYDHANMDTLLKAMDDDNMDVRRKAYQAVCRIFGREYIFNLNATSKERQVVIRGIAKDWKTFKKRVGDYRDLHRKPTK
jgi:HEAT repeat protein